MKSENDNVELYTCEISKTNIFLCQPVGTKCCLVGFGRVVTGHLKAVTEITSFLSEGKFALVCLFLV